MPESATDVVTNAASVGVMEALDVLASKLAGAITAAAPPRKKTIAEIAPVTNFNPTGNPYRELPCRVYVNGLRPNVATLMDSELTLLGKLRPGSFIGDRVTVTESKDGPERTIYVWYPNRTQEQRMENKSLWRNFEDMLQQCVAGAR